ncbi:hypothetical protein DFJ73DRAFT_171564 [Zopfochytrium polystomum]|nr:hypothetical protein DFJ73DRAFT_171564 [Zopfochytrium polystomum]
MKSTLTQIPQDVLYRIFELIEHSDTNSPSSSLHFSPLDHHHLLPLALVSRQWEAPVIRALYRRVSIRSWETMFRFARIVNQARTEEEDETAASSGRGVRHEYHRFVKSLAMDLRVEDVIGEMAASPLEPDGSREAPFWGVDGLDARMAGGGGGWRGVADGNGGNGGGSVNANAKEDSDAGVAKLLRLVTDTLSTCVNLDSVVLGSAFPGPSSEKPHVRLMHGAMAWMGPAGLIEVARRMRAARKVQLMFMHPLPLLSSLSPTVLQGFAVDPIQGVHRQADVQQQQQQHVEDELLEDDGWVVMGGGNARLQVWGERFWKDWITEFAGMEEFSMVMCDEGWDLTWFLPAVKDARSDLQTGLEEAGVDVTLQVSERFGPPMSESAEFQDILQPSLTTLDLSCPGPRVEARFVNSLASFDALSVLKLPGSGLAFDLAVLEISCPNLLELHLSATEAWRWNRSGCGSRGMPRPDGVPSATRFVAVGTRRTGLGGAAGLLARDRQPAVGGASHTDGTPTQHMIGDEDVIDPGRVDRQEAALVRLVGGGLARLRVLSIGDERRTLGPPSQWVVGPTLSLVLRLMVACVQRFEAGESPMGPSGKELFVLSLCGVSVNADAEGRGRVGGAGAGASESSGYRDVREDELQALRGAFPGVRLVVKLTHEARCNGVCEGSGVVGGLGAGLGRERLPSRSEGRGVCNGRARATGTNGGRMPKTSMAPRSRASVDLTDPTATPAYRDYYHNQPVLTFDSASVWLEGLPDVSAFATCPAYRSEDSPPQHSSASFHTHLGERSRPSPSSSSSFSGSVSPALSHFHTSAAPLPPPVPPAGTSGASFSTASTLPSRLLSRTSAYNPLPIDTVGSLLTPFPSVTRSAAAVVAGAPRDPIGDAAAAFRGFAAAAPLVDLLHSGTVRVAPERLVPLGRF